MRMRQVAGDLHGSASGQFFEGHTEIHFENQLFVVFEVDEQREFAEAGELFAEEPDVLARGPGVNNVRPAAVRKDARPFTVDPIKSMDRVILFAEAGAALLIIRDGDGSGMTQGRELVGEVVDVNSAIRAEVVVENEEDVAHFARRL